MVDSSDWSFGPLQNGHDKSAFECGHAKLDEYLRKFARTNHRKRIARVYVATRSGEQRVWGYYTLSGAQVLLDDLPEQDRGGLPAEVPGTLLGRMAVHSELQRGEEKLGTRMLMNAFARAEQGGEIVGSYFLYVDPKDDDSRRFYLGRGFSNMANRSDRLIYPMKKIRELKLPEPV